MQTTFLDVATNVGQGCAASWIVVDASTVVDEGGGRGIPAAHQAKPFAPLP